MKKRMLIAVIAILGLAMVVIPVGAKGGFDAWGYNYQANIFNGLYSNYNRPEPPYDPSNAPSDTLLIMKWSDEWLNEDRVRCAGTPQEGISACEGAWLTNHQRGEYQDDDEKTCKWVYFVKIVYPPGGAVGPNGSIDPATGGVIIWGAYVRILQVSNDTCAGEHGNIFSVQPAGFGAYK